MTTRTKFLSPVKYWTSPVLFSKFLQISKEFMEGYHVNGS
jgi:hypothetical protein